jgi:soluble epoxide hydrolase/lipid-phosphate phosphatase
MPIPIPNKTLTLPSSLKYAYIHHRPTSKTKPTLLFLHGFPSTSADWRYQITYFHSQGYGILVPDLLGYGGTSKPLSVTPYIGSSMSADIIAILDSEDITGPLIGIAHDWGTYLLSQLAARHQERFDKFVFLSVPFSPPGREMDVEQINRATKEKEGYEQFGYWLFLTQDGAGKIIGEHVRGVPSSLHFKRIVES